MKKIVGRRLRNGREERKEAKKIPQEKRDELRLKKKKSMGEMDEEGVTWK